jgi:hypothetical protein
MLIILGCESRESKNIAVNPGDSTKIQISENQNIEAEHEQNKELTKPAILVLTPYDKIANRGISPNIQKYLQDGLRNIESVELIEFPYNKLKNIPYQNIFDKRFCSPIIEKIKCDIIIMSKLDLVKQTGNMTTDRWNLRIRLYNIMKDEQIDSMVKLDNLTTSDLESELTLNNKTLIKEIIKTVGNN